VVGFCYGVRVVERQLLTGHVTQKS